MLEILAPAGSAECANAAIHNGANAIYLGLSSFSARQSAENFDESAFRAVLTKAHFCGTKVYVAMNTLVKDEELESFFKNLLFVWAEGADAIILQDVFLGKYVHEKYPEIVLHLSTQAGVCNVEGARFAKKCGFSRVILARETPIVEIEKIAQIIETEVFVQGALCTCFSGQCYFSSFAGGNSGNRGRCKQPCRKQYAYDRNGNTEKSYALSLSDLCVGADIQKLISAGVISFKIEGRMRRAEYVAAAVRYYRGVLDSGMENAEDLSALKRTYNRGNYTKGLAFGQDKRFLSPAVQGHLGEKLGVVKVVNAKYYVESRFKPVQKDAFKILRDGKEVGGATFVKTEGKGFIISSKVRLRNGDGVFITTDNAVNARVLRAQKQGELCISLAFKEGEYALAECGDVCMQSPFVLQSAMNRPLAEEELKACFSKTDGLPVNVKFEKISLQGNIFIPKSDLNAFRRAFFEKVVAAVAKNGHKEYEYLPIEKVFKAGNNEKTAVISNDFTGISTDIAIYKADDYTLPLPENFRNGNFEKYLYYPAFATQKDLLSIKEKLLECKIDGIYAENYGGVLFAKENGLQVFAGNGFNLTNTVSVQEFLGYAHASYYAVSKELNAQEAVGLSGERAFAFSLGDIKIMDLCYCPFGKTCSVCDKRQTYTLTDESGREFPVRRYVAADKSCRFEVYNCAALIGRGVRGMGKLIDVSATKDKCAVVCAIEDETRQKELYRGYTSGHLKRGVL